MRLYTFGAVAVCLFCLSACSNSRMAGDSDNSGGRSSEQLMRLMVIEPSDYSNNINKFCTHTSQCIAPLACIRSKCQVPPSLIDKHDDKTPTLVFKNNDVKNSLYIELVDDDYTTQRGMMMRKAFADGWGMLFVFPNESRHAFWMHHCYIPLDMVFIRADGSVDNTIQNAEPLNDGPRYPSNGKVKFVLELPVGSIQKYQITTSTVFDVSPYSNAAANFHTQYDFQP